MSEHSDNENMGSPAGDPTDDGEELIVLDDMEDESNQGESGETTEDVKVEQQTDKEDMVNGVADTSADQETTEDVAEKKTEDEEVKVQTDDEKAETEASADTKAEETKKEDEEKKTAEEQLAELDKFPIKEPVFLVSPFSIRDFNLTELVRILQRAVKFSTEFAGERNMPKTGVLKLEFDRDGDAYLALTRLIQRPFMRELKVTYADDLEGVNILEELRKHRLDKRELGRKVREKAAAATAAKAKAPQPKTDAKSVFANNIPPDTSEDSLKLMFPEATNVIIPTVGDDKKNQGYAILQFETPEAATKCLKENKDVEINSFKVNLSQIIPTKKTGDKKDGDKDKKERPSKSKSSGDSKKDSKPKNTPVNRGGQRMRGQRRGGLSPRAGGPRGGAPRGRFQMRKDQSRGNRLDLWRQRRQDQNRRRMVNPGPGLLLPPDQPLPMMMGGMSGNFPNPMMGMMGNAQMGMGMGMGPGMGGGMGQGMSQMNPLGGMGMDMMGMQQPGLNMGNMAGMGMGNMGLGNMNNAPMGMGNMGPPSLLSPIMRDRDEPRGRSLERERSRERRFSQSSLDDGNRPRDRRQSQEGGRSPRGNDRGQNRQENRNRGGAGLSPRIIPIGLGSSPRGNQEGGKKNLICRKCGVMGHIARECTNSSSNMGGNQQQQQRQRNRNQRRQSNQNTRDGQRGQQSGSGGLGTDPMIEMLRTALSSVQKKLQTSGGGQSSRKDFLTDPDFYSKVTRQRDYSDNYSSSRDQDFTADRDYSNFGGDRFLSSDRDLFSSSSMSYGQGSPEKRKWDTDLSRDTDIYGGGSKRQNLSSGSRGGTIWDNADSYSDSQPRQQGGNRNKGGVGGGGRGRGGNRNRNQKQRQGQGSGGFGSGGTGSQNFGGRDNLSSSYTGGYF